MKAPDKIYIQDGEIHRTSEQYDNDVCYIRKDALLEWLEGKMTIEGATEGFVGGYDSALKDVIEHINEM